MQGLWAEPQVWCVRGGEGIGGDLLSVATPGLLWQKHLGSALCGSALSTLEPGLMLHVHGWVGGGGTDSLTSMRGRGGRERCAA